MNFPTSAEFHDPIADEGFWRKSQITRREVTCARRKMNKKPANGHAESGPRRVLNLSALVPRVGRPQLREFLLLCIRQNEILNRLCAPSLTGSSFSVV